MGSPLGSLAEVAERYLPGWAGRLTPHVLLHYCASQLYRGGMSLFAIHELLGHSWTGTTAGYVNSRETAGHEISPRAESVQLPVDGGLLTCADLLVRPLDA